MTVSEINIIGSLLAMADHYANINPAAQTVSYTNRLNHNGMDIVDIFGCLKWILNRYDESRSGLGATSGMI